MEGSSTKEPTRHVLGALGCGLHERLELVPPLVARGNLPGVHRKPFRCPCGAAGIAARSLRTARLGSPLQFAWVRIPPHGSHGP